MYFKDVFNRLLLIFVPSILFYYTPHHTDTNTTSEKSALKMIGDSSKENFINKCLKTDIRAYDFLVSIFISTLSSYRHDTLVRPFPPDYVKLSESGHTEPEKDYDSLKKDVDNIRSLRTLFDERKETFQEKLQNLLCWIFSPKTFTIKTCDLKLFEEIRERSGYTFQAAQPTYIFSIHHSPASDEKFEKLRNNRDVIYGYHGSKLENFYSILHHGLKGNLNKNALFGEGTYLSSELSVGLDYSPYGHGWSQSCLGSRLSCIAVCEMIDDPSVKCKVQGSTDNKSRSRIEGSLGGELPEKYYVVTNDECVRVKYLLVYASRDKYLKKEPSWYQRNKFIFVIIIYGLLLLAVGMYKSPSVKKYIDHLFLTI